MSSRANVLLGQGVWLPWADPATVSIDPNTNELTATVDHFTAGGVVDRNVWAASFPITECTGPTTSNPLVSFFAEVPDYVEGGVAFTSISGIEPNSDGYWFEQSGLTFFDSDIPIVVGRRYGFLESDATSFDVNAATPSRLAQFSATDDGGFLTIDTALDNSYRYTRFDAAGTNLYTFEDFRSPDQRPAFIHDRSGFELFAGLQTTSATSTSLVRRLDLFNGENLSSIPFDGPTGPLLYSQEGYVLTFDVPTQGDQTQYQLLNLDFNSPTPAFTSAPGRGIVQTNSAVFWIDQGDNILRFDAQTGGTRTFSPPTVPGYELELSTATTTELVFTGTDSDGDLDPILVAVGTTNVLIDPANVMQPHIFGQLSLADYFVAGPGDLVPYSAISAPGVDRLALGGRRLLNGQSVSVIVEVVPSEFDGGNLGEAGDLDVDLDEGVGDGIPDCFETQGWVVRYRPTSSNPNLIDTDGDGLADGEELEIVTISILGARSENPWLADALSELLGRPVETRVGLPYSDPRETDSDFDDPLVDPVTGLEFILDDLAERTIGTDPMVRDTDGDGFDDPVEALAGTSRTSPDDNLDIDPDGCFRGGGNLFIAATGVVVEGQSLEGCEYVAGLTGCLVDANVAVLRDDSADVECDLPAYELSDGELAMGDVFATLEEEGALDALDASVEVLCTSTSWCGAVITPSETGTIKPKPRIEREARRWAPRVLLRAAGRNAAPVSVVVAAAELTFTRLDQERVDVLLEIDEEVQQQRVEQGLAELPEPEVKQRTEQCTTEEVPWEEALEETGAVSTNPVSFARVDDQGFITVTGNTTNPFFTDSVASHACLTVKIYFPGESAFNGRPLSQTTQHQREAIGTHPPAWFAENDNRQILGPVGAGPIEQRPWADSQDLPQPTFAFDFRTMRRTPEVDGTEWYNTKPECRKPRLGTTCDEFPFASTITNQALVVENLFRSGSLYPSLKLVDGQTAASGRDEQTAQFLDIGRFYADCPVVEIEDAEDPSDAFFMVVPQDPSPGTESYWICVDE